VQPCSWRSIDCASPPASASSRRWTLFALGRLRRQPARELHADGEEGENGEDDEGQVAAAEPPGGLTGLGEVLAAQLEEAAHALLLALDALGQIARVFGRALGEVLQAALGVVGQRIDVGDVLLRAGDPQRRTALRQRAGAAHRATVRRFSGATSATGISRWAGNRTCRSTLRSIATSPSVNSCSGSRQIARTVSAAVSASRSARAWSA